MDFQEFKAKTVEEAVTAATVALGITSDELEYEVVEKGSTGFLGLGAKPAIIKAKKKEEEVVNQTVSTGLVDKTKVYLDSLFKAMDIETEVTIDFDEENNNMDINLEGSEMGILIGKRGQTLDALQYLISLYVNKESEAYVRVKLDTENYRARRKDTLENLAKNIAFKVKRSRRSVTLEPMNPYERRIIHSALQNDKYVATRSEGEEPYRKVVVYLKK
ncbi:MAG: protein jag [Lachnospiraceae bacterium]|nr:protein jag [Lachnospiraceae bacterium]HCJ08146.1 DNA-binding protein [Lachnospiraceae bacterium]